MSSRKAVPVKTEPDAQDDKIKTEEQPQSDQGVEDAVKVKKEPKEESPASHPRSRVTDADLDRLLRRSNARPMRQLDPVETSNFIYQHLGFRLEASPQPAAMTVDGERTHLMGHVPPGVQHHKNPNNHNGGRRRGRGRNGRKAWNNQRGNNGQNARQDQQGQTRVSEDARGRQDDRSDRHRDDSRGRNRNRDQSYRDRSYSPRRRDNSRRRSYSRHRDSSRRREYGRSRSPRRRQDSRRRSRSPRRRSRSPRRYSSRH